MMFHLLRVSLVTAGVMSNVWGSEATDPLKTGNEPVSQNGKTEEPWNTQVFLENMLREEGVLSENEHLAPHEVWRLADFLKARIKARRVLKEK
jgi:hypothetical protein